MLRRPCSMLHLVGDAGLSRMKKAHPRRAIPLAVNIAKLPKRAAADIEGITAAKFGQPGLLSYKSLTIQASECRHFGHL